MNTRQPERKLPVQFHNDAWHSGGGGGGAVVSLGGRGEKK